LSFVDTQQTPEKVENCRLSSDFPFRGTLGSGLEVNFAKARQVKQGMMQELLEDLPNKISTSSS